MVKKFLLNHLTQTDYKIINLTKNIFNKLKIPFDIKLLGLNLNIGELMFFVITGSIAYVFIANNEYLQNKISAKIQEDERVSLVLVVSEIVAIVVIMTI